MPGYCFKKGGLGLGYYLDGDPAVADAANDQCEQEVLVLRKGVLSLERRGRQGSFERKGRQVSFDRLRKRQACAQEHDRPDAHAAGLAPADATRAEPPAGYWGAGATRPGVASSSVPSVGASGGTFAGTGASDRSSGWGERQGELGIVVGTLGVVSGVESHGLPDRSVALLAQKEHWRRCTACEQAIPMPLMDGSTHCRRCGTRSTWARLPRFLPARTLGHLLYEFALAEQVRSRDLYTGIAEGKPPRAWDLYSGRNCDAARTSSARKRLFLWKAVAPRCLPHLLGQAPTPNDTRQLARRTARHDRRRNGRVFV